MRTETLVTHIMAINPVTVEKGQTLAHVRRNLSSERFHHLPVVDQGKVVGLISLGDLLRLGVDETGTEDSALLDKQVAVADIMQEDPITISHRATIGEAAKILSAGGFHALPVVDEDQRLQGMLTTTDLCTFLLIESPAPEAKPEMLERLKGLERVFKAAELYLHSGLSSEEHARLEQAIRAVRKSETAPAFV